MSPLQAALPAIGMSELPVTAAHAAEVTALPLLHADPFDRLLVAQGRVEGLTVLSNDVALGRYGGDVQIVS